MAGAPLLALRPPPLQYPGGVPLGVDLTNPAIDGSPAWISAACLGSANMVSLGSGQPGTIVTGPLAVAMNGGVGPSITKSASTATYTKFTDPAGANTNQYFTAAAIYQLSSLAATNGLINNTTTASTGFRTFVFTGGQVSLLNGGTTVLGGTAGTVVAGVPYATIFCNSPSGAFSYTINLSTGKITLSTATASGAPATTSGLFMVGNDATTTNRVATGLARAMWSNQPISKQQALQWLNNPWSFWHPALAGVSVKPLVGVSGGGTVTGTLAVTEQNDTLSAAGDLVLAGTLAVTEQNDTLSATGTTGNTIAGTLAVTEQNDTLSATGDLVLAGTLAVTEQNDTLSATGDLVLAGALAVTEQDDTLSATGTTGAASATLAVTEQNDTLSATGSLGAAPVTDSGGGLPRHRPPTQEDREAFERWSAQARQEAKAAEERAAADTDARLKGFGRIVAGKPAEVVASLREQADLVSEKRVPIPDKARRQMPPHIAALLLY